MKKKLQKSTKQRLPRKKKKEEKKRKKRFRKKWLGIGMIVATLTIGYVLYKLIKKKNEQSKQQPQSA